MNKDCKINIIDTTLRDGEQAPGVVFSLDEKMRICELLDNVGIPEVELGIPAISDSDAKDIRTIINQNLSFKSLVWARCRKDDIDAAIKTKGNGLHISLPVSSIHLNALGKNWNWVHVNLWNAVNYAKDYFEYVTVGAQDASRVSYKFLKEYIGEASALGIKRIRIADTVGIMNPVSVKGLFKKLKKDFPDMPFEFHGHNDLGMAVANTFSAFMSGADSASVTVNGLGERAGNAALEEVAMALELSGHKKLGLHTEYFSELSCFVEKASRRPLSFSKPVTGKYVLSHESGIHVQAMVKDRKTYQIIDPDSIGTHEPDFIIGKHSGKAAIKGFFAKRGIILSDEDSGILLKYVKEKSSLLKRSLTVEELLNYFKELKECENKGIVHCK